MGLLQRRLHHLFLENKVYFLYVARVSGHPAILGATVMGGESIQEKIDALNEVLKTLDSETLTMEEIAEYRAQIKEIKELSEYVLDRDFETAALAEAEKKYQDHKLPLVDEVYDLDIKYRETKTKADEAAQVRSTIDADIETKTNDQNVVKSKC